MTYFPARSNVHDICMWRLSEQRSNRCSASLADEERFMTAERIIVVTWGQAQLIRFQDGHHELQGGTSQDRADARAWLEMFMPALAQELKEQENPPHESP